MPHRNQPITKIGAPLTEADTAMILLHGRGDSAQGILDLARVLPKENMAYLAPQAAGHSWYPYGFMADIEQNEPYLSSALALIETTVQSVVDAGIPTEKLIIGGFSQGACLSSEFIARHPAKYGGLLAFSGGLIGPAGQLPDYAGNLQETPVFMGCSDVDAHIPLARVEETAEILTNLGANVTKWIFPGMGHTINSDEIKEAQGILLR
ncbi:MAG: alpha/beta hydrolase, partial [Rhodothermales bacterium]